MNYVQIILHAAKMAKVSGFVLLAICTQETKLQNIVHKNDGGSHSYGICQVKMDTAKMLGYEGPEEDLNSPEINAKWAANYLRYQQLRYGDMCKAVAAYNAGRYNESKVMPGYPRNLKYVNSVNKILTKISTQHFTCDINYTKDKYAQNHGFRLRVQSAK